MGILNTITKALGLDNTKKTPKEPTRIPKTVQDSIPYLGAYENGPMRVVFTFVISFGIGTSIMEHSSLHIERLPGS